MEPDIIEIIRNHKAFSSSRATGQKGLGFPEEYENLVVEDGDTIRTFEYFNKGISYMISGGEEDRPVFKVFANLMSMYRSR